MVKTDIWMPVFIGDYLADTMHLSTEQHGAYLLLLFHLWRRGSLRDEDAVLAQICGLGASAWNLQRPVLAEFFRIQDGLWQHGRVEKERARVASSSNPQPRRRSWRPQAGGVNAVLQALLKQCLSMPIHIHIHIQNHIHIQKQKKHFQQTVCK